MSDKDEFKSRLKFRYTIKDKDLVIAKLLKIIDEYDTLLLDGCTNEEIRDKMWWKPGQHLDDGQELLVENKDAILERIEWIEGKK